ncbi:MAG: single-stranded-DNA-specific exonuclease RecJ [Clostridiales bacterium]|nr:single-stranded-DNA-specific exonuclease RecJ [Clostridiales bacterium]
MEFIKKYKEQFNIKELEKFAKRFDISVEVVKLLFSRGLDTEDKIEKFIGSGVTQLNNPFLLSNMDKVVEKIKSNIANNKNILIMGDYDTDGISASAILYKYFESIGKKVNVFLPNRFVDGYGLTCESLDKVKDLYSPDLIITVDCGITCVEEIEYCKKLGIDIIVTDHHDIPQVLPNTLIINPKLDGQLYPFKELCGAGVALKLVHALGGLEEALKYTTIASLATVADIVPLMEENRAIVKLGLEHQKEQLPKGLKKLCSRLKMSLPLTSSDISFKMAPKINATGRMGDASISFRLYIEKDDSEIEKNINLLLELNDKRVAETNVIFESACEMLEGTNVSRLGMIVLYNEKWESGVLGIICSKLVEKYNKPVCLLSKVDDEYKGSCRSIPAVNIFDALTSVQDLLIRFGGHNQAGGLSIEGKNLKEFRKRINDYVLNNTKEEDLVTRKTYDLDLSNAVVDAKFVKDLEIFEPTGFKNEKPTFRFQIDNNSAVRMSNFPQHLRIKYKDLNFIAFNKGDYYYNLNVNCLKEIIVELFIEKFSKKEKISGFVRNINYSKINTATKSEIVGANYLTQLKLINFKSEYNNYKTMKFDVAIAKINELCKKSKFGTAVLINDMDTYFAVTKQLPDICNYELFDIKNACGENVIVFSPDASTNLKDYDNIFLLDSFLCEGYVSSLSTKFNKIYAVQDRLNISLFNNLDTSRDTFARIHNAIRLANITTAVPDLVTYFNQLRKINLIDKSIKYNQFIFFLMVMEELGIMKFTEGVLEINNGIKSNLKDSVIYNFVIEFLKIK